MTESNKINYEKSLSKTIGFIGCLIILISFLFPSYSSGQVLSKAKKPTIMILPSDNWCHQRYFISKYDNQGTIVTVPNYYQAFTEDIELPQVLTKLGALLTDLGYSIKDAEQELKSINLKTSENTLIYSKNGASLVETPLDILKQRIKSDIIIQIWWNFNDNNRTTSFILEAFDAYTNKRIASSTGTTKPSNESIEIVLAKAVKDNLKPFDRQLDLWYQDMLTNGREIVLNVRIWDNWHNDLESDFAGMELIEVIQKWLHNNCVNGAFNLSDASESFAQFEQVRIPLFNSSGVSMDARAFTNELRKYLQKPPYNISSKIIIRGLGEATLVLGEK